MKNLKPLSALALMLSAPFAATGKAQSVPADTGTPSVGVGFTLPSIGGSVSYALNAAELFSKGFYSNSGTYETTSLSGDAAYVSKSQFHPFSAIYTGGVLLGNSSQPNTVFQSLSFSQVLSTKHWNIVAADTVSYLPESPVGGLSGIPGVGDLGVDPVEVGPATGLGILTTYGPRVSNYADGTIGRQISGRVSGQVSGTYGIQRFIGDNSGLALDSTTAGGSAGLSYHFSARNSLTGNYNYSRFTYTGSEYTFTTQGATLNYSRQWNARLVTDVYAGPQIITGNSALFNGTSVELAAGATAAYQSRLTVYSLRYSRGVNNGSGVIPGSFSDNVVASVRRQFGRKWSLSGDVGFSRTEGLPNLRAVSFDGKAETFGVQGNRAFARYFSGYVTYTLEHQSTTERGIAFGGQNAFNGLYQVVGIGVSYSPRSILLGR